MGSAASAVGGAVGGVLGGGIQGITQGVLPGASFADPSKARDAINALANDAQGYQANYSNAIGQANQQFGNAVGSFGTSRDALALLRNQAAGTAPTAAQAQLQSGKDQAIATQSALANSGNLSQMISGQKTAMDNAANLTQQAANQAAQLRAQEIAIGQQNYANAANTNTANQSNLFGAAASNAQNQGALSNSANIGAGNIAIGQSGQQQQALNQAQAQQANAAGGMLNGLGGAAATLLSDEDQKTNIQSERAKGISKFFKEDRGEDKPKEDTSSAPAKGLDGYADDDPRKKVAQQIKEGFISDEETKKEVKHKGSMLHAFLDGLDPVTFEYKEPTGEMGKTPGTHMGIIAQDVEKAPGGKSMIIETPEGKAIDMASAMGMLMSAAADAHERMSSLEELFKSKKVK